MAVDDRLLFLAFGALKSNLKLKVERAIRKLYPPLLTPIKLPCVCMSDLVTYR